MKDEKVKLDVLVSSRLKAKAEQVCKDKRITMNQFVGRAFREYFSLLKEREELKGKKWIRYVLYHTPQKGSKAERVLKYLIENRLEGNRQVYYIPDLMENCELTSDEVNEFNFIDYLFDLKGSDVTWGCSHAVTNSLRWKNFLVLDTGRGDAWGVLVELYNDYDHNIKEPSEEVKNFITWLDSEEGKAEQEELERNYSKALAEWLFGVPIDEEDNQ